MNYNNQSYNPPMSGNRSGLQNDCLAICPPSVARYVSQSLDTNLKVINHLLCGVSFCTFFLFTSSWGANIIPTVGLNMVLISFLFTVHTISVYFTLNHAPIAALQFLSPTPFMVGVALGTTVGAAVLALLISSSYRRISNCDNLPAPDNTANGTNSTPTPPDGDPVLEFLCEQYSSNTTGIWFWSGLIFWLNFGTALLISMGQNELTRGAMQYQNVGTQDMGGGGAPQAYGVGNYSNIPEIRGAGANGQSFQNAPPHVQNV